jgi:hypothetical protein
MKYLINLFGDIIYHKVPFTMMGLSGGSKIYRPDDYIPDKITHIHESILN